MNVKDMILYEDMEILVCRKPAGLAVESAGIGVMDLISMLKNELGSRQQGMPYLGMIHRLDQPVEGVLVFAKNKKAAAELSRQVTDGRMKKIYRAVCCCADRVGELPGDGETLVDYLKKDARTNTSAIVPEHTPGAKRAELRYRVLEECVKDTAGEAEPAAKDEKKPAAEDKKQRLALVEIELLTGRHHQIRVQMAGAGLPLYGDQKYNSKFRGTNDADRNGGSRRPGMRSRTQLALCAASLTFVHPTRKKEMQFEVKPSAEVFGAFQAAERPDCEGN